METKLTAAHVFLFSPTYEFPPLPAGAGKVLSPKSPKIKSRCHLRKMGVYTGCGDMPQQPMYTFIIRLWRRGVSKQRSFCSSSYLSSSSSESSEDVLSDRCIGGEGEGRNFSPPWDVLSVMRG